MTKSDLIERLCLGQKLPKGKAELLVDTIFDCLEQALRRGERIEIRGFGSFEIRSYKAYQGRNPKTGVPVPVREKRLPFFKVGKELKERVNPPGDGAAGNGASAAQIDDDDDDADETEDAETAESADGAATRATRGQSGAALSDGAGSQGQETAPAPLDARE